MKNIVNIWVSFVALLVAIAFSPSAMAAKPMEASANVSMTLYQLRQEADGKQYVISRDGSLVPLPAPGLAPGSSQIAIYGDKKGNFWYQGLNGSAVSIHDDRLTWKDSQSYAKDEEDKPKSRREKRKERRRGALGSLLGAATGAALTNAAYGNYNGVPYGYPLYGSPNSMYYLGPNGTPVYINTNGENLSHLYSQWNTQQQLVHQNRLQYQNAAQQSALQFQQQAHQNSLVQQQQRQTARQNSYPNYRQKNLESRAQLQENRTQNNFRRNRNSTGISSLEGGTRSNRAQGRFANRSHHFDRSEGHSTRRARHAKSNGTRFSGRFSRSHR